MKKRTCYFILETVTDTDGGYIPCIAKENEPGYWKTDWNWGTDLEQAREIAREKNAALGISPQDAWTISTSSMVASRENRARRFIWSEGDITVTKKE
jgi:hypothetical protein